MSDRMLKKWVLQIFLVSVFTTMLLMLHLSRTQSHEENMKQSILDRKSEIKEKLREERLGELQRTLFIHPDRPPDEKYNINVSASERIPLRRHIPDSRPDQCKNLRYDINKLPTLTVIIPFYNEALSMLLRTVHSILDRTPPSLLAQIILVNDHSPNKDLGEPLEKYIKLMPKVQMVKTLKREGLIRARMIGAGMATGEVLMFQDAHTENNVQWAEPLLEEIRKNPMTVIQPQVDAIEQWSIEYTSSHMAVPRGGFTWDLRYVWMMMPEHEKQRVPNDWDPHRIATLVGCALMVHKDTFLRLGGFDDGMNVWGGENIELAFRYWMCGGQVLNHPCSRIGHVFKPFAYSFDGDREKIVQKNQMRIAELWMDDWKKYFYAATYAWETKRTYLTPDEQASLEKRKMIKKNFNCKGFKWFMENIVPEIPTPKQDAVYYGEVTNLKTEACLYMAEDGYVAMSYMCFFHRLIPENIFYIDVDGRLIHQKYRYCIRVETSTWLLVRGECLVDNDEKWDVVPTNYYEGAIRVKVLHPGTGKMTDMCITQVTNINKVHMKEQMPQLLECSVDNHKEFQGWRFQYKLDFNYNFDPPAS